MLYVIAGPTASGKTAAAINLAHQINGEIINADSMQVYQHMHIGTAKPTMKEREGIPHHLLDIIPPDRPFSVATYQKLAQETIAEIRQRGNVPILVGGTGFYINAVVYNTDFTAQTSDDTTHRDYYTQLASTHGANHIHALLTTRDPQSAAAIHPQNIKRVTRALAYIETTGTLFSAHNATQREKKSHPPPHETVIIVLDWPRDQLYDRINQRTVQMLNNGLQEEATALLQKGYSPTLPALQAIGYKEIYSGLTGDHLRDTIAQNTRRYAKRQLTWFRNSTPHARWIDFTNNDITQILTP